MMTARDAMLYVRDGYEQCELQLIWATSVQPIVEIMSLPAEYTRGEAQRLWNARHRGAMECNPCSGSGLVEAALSCPKCGVKHEVRCQKCEGWGLVFDGGQPKRGNYDQPYSNDMLEGKQ
jgi:predicted RNA-binding Zn-ribbon protein involved in translation (DUF1610 family)